MRRYVGALVVIGVSGLLAAAEERSADEQRAIHMIGNPLVRDGFRSTR